MKVLIILGIIVLALVLLSFVRLGVMAEYSESGLLVQAKVGPLKLTVYPRKTDKPKKRKRKQKPEGEAPKKGGNLALVKRFLPLISEAAGQAKKKIRIDVLHLDFTAAASDPATAAMTFGGANAAIGMLWPLFEQNFRVEDRRIRTAVDFDARAPVIYLFVQATLSIGQAIGLGGRLGFKFLKLFMQYRAETKGAQSDTKTDQKEAV